jgi:hypothetical protein
MTEHKQPDWTELEAAARDELELIEVVADEIAADFKHTARAKSLRGAASRLLSALRAVEGERGPTNQQDRTPDDVLLVPSDVGGAQPAGPVLGDITGHSRLWHTLQVFARDTGALAGSDVLEWFVTHTDTLKARWNVQDELFERLQAAEARASTAEARVAELEGERGSSGGRVPCAEHTPAQHSAGGGQDPDVVAAIWRRARDLAKEPDDREFACGMQEALRLLGIEEPRP